MRRKKTKIAIISLTFERKDYIQRSFESLWQRAGMPFDLYVFDDKSGKDVKEYLKEKKKEGKIKKIVWRRKNLNIIQNFADVFKYIPDRYDYYIKWDSDIEALSDNFLVQMVEVAQLPDFGCIVPRIEGIFAPDTSSTVLEGNLEFFNGHAIRAKNSVPYGACIFFSKEIRDYNEKFVVEREELNEDFKLDTRLYQWITDRGKEIIVVEDLSVYHIDGVLGQRRKYWEYFRKRNRWEKLDVQHNDFLKVSKEIGPYKIDRNVYEQLHLVSNKNYKDFKKLVKEFLKDPSILEKAKERAKMLKNKEKKRLVGSRPMFVDLKTVYRITSPMNYPKDSHIPHGESREYAKIPEWAKNNPKLVIEKVEVSKPRKAAR